MPQITDAIARRLLFHRKPLCDQPYVHEGLVVKCQLELSHERRGGFGEHRHLAEHNGERITWLVHKRAQSARNPRNPRPQVDGSRKS